jgi:hypothetical protein
MIPPLHIYREICFYAPLPSTSLSRVIIRNSYITVSFSTNYGTANTHSALRILTLVLGVGNTYADSVIGHAHEPCCLKSSVESLMARDVR